MWKWKQMLDDKKEKNKANVKNVKMSQHHL